jgi:BirA family transcriptional regulator, biotin operon repressor / biotin---[acetyl-CoA-carboxylase] ligase
LAEGVTTDAAILFSLRKARTNGISGAALSQQLGISRAAIWARIEELRRLGYEIDASPHAGYHLIKVPDVLHGDDLMARLAPACLVGRDIRVFKETTSTNDVVEKLAHDRVPEGVVVFAEGQSRGRGRLSRRWESSAGQGLWFSILLRPAISPQAATQITIAAAVALARAIRLLTDLKPQIKWPNDVQIEGRKIAGILTEMSAEVDRVRFLILGIGINVNQDKSHFPSELRSVATSLKIETGTSWERAALAARVLEEFDADYARVRRGKFEAVADEWAAICSTLGKVVKVQMGDRVYQGTAEALDSDGALMLRSAHGSLERILGGDVTVVK